MVDKEVMEEDVENTLMVDTAAVRVATGESTEDIRMADMGLVIDASMTANMAVAVDVPLDTDMVTGTPTVEQKKEDTNIKMAGQAMDMVPVETIDTVLVTAVTAASITSDDKDIVMDEVIDKEGTAIVM